MSTRRKLLLVLGCLAGLAVNGYLKRPALPYIWEGDNDFRGFYASTQLAGSSDLYNPAAIERAESKLGERPRFLPVVRLPFYIALISPLRLFPYRTAYWIWQLVSLGAAGVFVWFWPGTPRWIAALACCWSAPLLDCFVMGRDVTVVLMLLAVSLALLFRGRHFAAGCVLSLCLMKYNLFVPLPLLIVGKRLWRFGGGVAAGGALLLAASFAVGGWRWPWSYLAELRMPTTTPNYSGIPNLHGWLGPAHHVALEAAAMAAALLAVWLVIRGADLARAVAAMLAGGLLVSYHAFFGDAALLIPVSLYLLRPSAGAAEKLAAIVLLCPLAYLPFSMSNPPFPPPLVLLLPLAAMAAEDLAARWGSPLRVPATSAGRHLRRGGAAPAGSAPR